MYTELLGRLISNLWSLETVIRYFICIKTNTPIPEIDELKIGDEVENGYFTNFHTLGKIIDEYNSICIDNSQKIEKQKILDIRDLLAHGRIQIKDTANINKWYLVKFSDPKKDVSQRIKLTHKVRPNHDRGAWLKRSINLVNKEIEKVGENGNFKITKNKNLN